MSGTSAIFAMAAAASGAPAGSARLADSDWEAVRRSTATQFAPLPPIKPQPTPAWLQWLGDALEAIFGPAAKVLVAAWPVLEKVLIVLAVLLALYLAWRLLGPLLTGWRPRRDKEEAWAPSREEALALLDDADRLAQQGRYGEATHLLLQRSVGQIRAARPGDLVPASTAREIAGLPQLPARAREAFGVIAGRVERCLFALRDLDASDWTTARAAYADFALAELRG